MKMQKAMSKFI